MRLSDIIGKLDHDGEITVDSVKNDLGLNAISLLKHLVDEWARPAFKQIREATRTEVSPSQREHEQSLPPLIDSGTSRLTHLTLQRGGGGSQTSFKVRLPVVSEGRREVTAVTVVGQEESSNERLVRGLGERDEEDEEELLERRECGGFLVQGGTAKLLGKVVDFTEKSGTAQCKH